jgi:microcystin-dependent protein
MRRRVLAAAALAVMAIAEATAPASAESSGYTVSPAGPTDPRNNFVPQSSAVFVVDNAKGSIRCVTPTIRTTRSW